MDEIQEHGIEDGDAADLIALLSWVAGAKGQRALGRLSGIDPSIINRYISGQRKPPRSALEKLAAAAGVRPENLGFIEQCRRLLRRAAPAPGKAAPPRPKPLPAELVSELREVVERWLALGRAERRLPEPAAGSVPPTARDHERAETLARALLSLSPGHRSDIVASAPEYQDPLVCFSLCRKSEAEAPDDATAALHLAELALTAARHLPHEDLKPRAAAWCLAHVANCERVQGNGLPRAARTFAEARKLWGEGNDPAGLFSEAHFLHMEASLRRAQRLFKRAHELHSQALELARPDEEGPILLNQAGTHQDEGEHEKALQALARAAELVDERQPRVRFGVRFNQAANLIELGRAAEAEPIVAEVRVLVERLDKATDRVRTLWLDGRCAAALGRREEALAALEEVREAFRGQAFDYALVSLDVALLYREEGRLPEIAALAGEILEIFRAQEVHREALAAVLLLQDAAAKARVSAGMLQRLRSFLNKARSQPGLKFGG